IHHLTGDLTGLLDALGIERAVFAGHDWGGIVTWALPLLHPERVLGVIGVNTPFMARPPIEPVGFMRQAFGEAMYMVVFQEPGRAEAILEGDVEKSLRFLFRKVRLPAELLDSTEGRKQALAWIGALAAQEGMPDGELVMDEAALAVYRETFTATGFTGGLNWYRNFTRNWESTEGLEQRIDAPCLMIAAADDFVLRPSMTDGMERYIPDLEKHVIEDCGHWTQMEQPEVLNRLMLDWLGRRFGGGG
ncbi:MAG: alpha/beta hydrolase, partial [bacterium]